MQAESIAAPRGSDVLVVDGADPSGSRRRGASGRVVVEQRGAVREAADLVRVVENAGGEGGVEILRGERHRSGDGDAVVRDRAELARCVELHGE